MTALRIAFFALVMTARAATAADVPREREESAMYDFVQHNLFRPVARTLDLARWARRISGQSREAANVDERDEVRLPSTWWQPRLGYEPIEPEEIASCRATEGPVAGVWTVTKAKAEGASPGFQMKDAAGSRYFLKLDTPGQPEMSTGAEVVASLLFCAAGYNVPENFIVTFDVESLQIAEDATYRDRLGTTRR